MSRKVTKADWEEYQKRKKEDEEKKRKQNSSSASATKSIATKKATATNPVVKTTVTTKKETPKLSESKYTKPSYSTPFSSVAENLKKQNEINKSVNNYITGQIDSTVAENMGVNTKAVDNYTQERKNQAFKNQEQRKLATIDDSTLERLGYDSYGLQKAKEDAKKVEQKTNDFITASRRYNDVQKYMDDGALKPFAAEAYRQDQEKKREDTEINFNKSTFPYQQRNDLKSEIVDRYQDKVQSYYDLVDGNPEFEDYTKLHNFSNIYDAMNSFFTDKYGKDTTYGKMLTGNAFEEWNDIYNDFKTNKRLSKEASTMNLPQKMINAMTVGGQEAMDNISSYGKVIPQNNYNSIYLNALRKSAKSTPEKLAIGASSAFGGMVPSMTFASMVPGAGLSSSSSALSKLVTPSNVAAVSNFLNESQSTYQDQIRQGASYSEAKLMGDATGTVNALLEKYLGNIPGMSDGSGGIVSKLGKNQISNIASGIRKSVKNPALRAMLIGGGKTAVSFLDEGMEEYIQDAIAAPVVEAVVKGQLPEFALASPEAIESFVVGGILGGTLNLPSNISETITDAKNSGNIQPDMPQTTDYSAPFTQNAPQNTENVASAFDVREKENTSDIVNSENTNSLTTQNKGNLEGVENYSEETQNVLSRLTPAGRELLLTGKMSVAHIDSLANEINDPTSENNSKSARRERIKNALDEVQSISVKNETVIDNDSSETKNASEFLEDTGEKISINQRIKENIPALSQLESVSNITKNEFPVEVKSLRTQVADFFEKLGGKVTRDGFGEVVINKKGIRNSISHGFGQAKAAAFKSVPDVIKNGIQIDYQQNWKGRQYESYVFAAPVTYDGDRGYVAAVVLKDNSSNRFYLHEIVDVNGDLIKIKDDGGKPSSKTLREEIIPKPQISSLPSGNSISQSNPTVNPENSQNVTPRPQVEGILKNRVEGILTPMAQNNVNIDTTLIEKLPKNNGIEQGEKHQQIIQTSEDVKKANKKSFKEWFSDVKRGLQNEFVTTSESFERADKKNGSDLTNRFYDAMASKYVGDYNINAVQTNINGDPLGKSLNEIFSRFYDKVIRNKKGDFIGFKGKISDPDYFAEVTNYVYAKHNIERSKEGKGFLSDELAWTPEQIAEFEANHPEAVEFQKELTQYYRNLLKNSVDAGLISRADANAFESKYPNYVPTQRMVDSKNETKDMDSISSNDIVEILQGEGLPSNGYSVSTGIKKAGDNKTLDLLPLYEQAQARTYSFIKNQMRNNFSNAVAKESANIDDILSLQKINDKKFREAAPNEVVFYVDGQKYSMRISKYMKYGFDELYNKNGRSQFEKVMGGIMTPFKAGITEYDPTFALRNFERDFQDALVYSKDLQAYVASAPTAWREMATNGELWQLYRAKGGMSNYRVDKNNRYKKPNTLSQAQQIIEQLPRFTEFVATIEKGGRSEANVRQAMQNARDITVNFQRGGKITKFANRTFVPFLNPSVQGLSKTIRTFTDIAEGNSNVSKGKALANTAKKAGLLGARLAALGIVPSLLNELFLRDDEEYKKIDERIKQSYYIFKVGDTKFLYLPKGRLVSVVGEIGRDTIKFANGEEVSVLDFLENAWTQQGVTDPVDSNIFAPLYRVAQNKTWYGGDIENSYDVTGNGIKPFNERYDPSTTEWAKGLSNAAYAVASALNVEDKVELGPKRIENLVDSYGGVFADVAFAMGRKNKSNEGGSLIGKDDKFNYAKGFVSAVGDKFLLDTSVKTNIPGKYYDMLKKYNKAGNSEKATNADKFVQDYVNNSTEISEANKAYSKAKQSGNVDTTRKAKATLDGLMTEKMDSMPKYKEAAEKVLAKYPDFDYANATEKEKNYIQMQIDKEFGGSEYAIQNLNKKTYEKAQENHDAHDLSYDDIYAYLLEKQTLPEDISNEDEFKHMENWLLNTKDISSIDAKNALGTAYVKETMTLTDEYNYDFTDKNSMDISKMTNTDEAKYYKTKQVFGDVVTPETYNYYKKAYDSGETEKEKMAALRAAGLNESSAKAFYGIQSGQKAYKTGVTGTETRLRKEMNFHSSLAKDIVSEYEKVYNSNPEKERQMQINFVRNIVKQLNPEYISYFGGENGTVNAMLKILDDM